MKKNFRALRTLLMGSVAVFSLACTPVKTDLEGLEEENFHWAETAGERNVLKRAYMIAKCPWIPLNNIPNNYGVYYAGNMYEGIPYSSTKKINKYVGLDVSFYTFLTAVKNPNSVLYTEHIGRPPYNGVNCATYYGTVCSTAVDFALGINEPYPSDYFPELNCFFKVNYADLSELKLGDVAYKKGHVFMIYRLHVSGNQVEKVEYLESAGSMTTIRTQSSSDFLDRIQEDNYSFFRYKYIDRVGDYLLSDDIIAGDERITGMRYNESLCPNRGDQCVYRIDEDIIVDVFDLSFNNLVIESGGVEVMVLPADKNEIPVKGLPAGKYTAYLSKSDARSQEIGFIVADPKVEVTVDDFVHISFSCDGARPIYCVFTDSLGDFHYIYTFNEADIASGHVILNKLEGKTYLYKVVFRTDYGTVINNPIAADNIRK